MSTESGQRWRLLIFAAVFLVALVLRLLPFEQVFMNGRVYYYDPDCYMRLRKVLIYLTTFPQTAIHDYFQGYPQGTGVITPPTMEYLLAALLWPLRSLPSFVPLLERLIALIPPILGALTALLLCRFTTSIAGIAAGLTAGFVLAVIPAHLEATILGRFDNEMIEPLLLLLVFWRYTRTYGNRARPADWLATGLLATLYLSIWRGGIAFLGIIGIDLLRRVFSCRGRISELSRLGRGAALMYGTTALFMAVICLTDLWGSRLLFTFNILSWFHVALFIGAATFFVVLTRYLGRSLGAGLTAGATTILLLGLLLGKQLIAGIALIRGGNAWLDSIAQYQHYSGMGAFLGDFGLAIVLLPVGLCLLAREPLRQLPERHFIVLWGVAIVLATTVRLRYGEYLALNVALAAGISAAALVRRFPFAPVRAGVLFLAALLLAQFPAYGNIMALQQPSSMGVYRGDLEEALLWLKENTPPAGDPYRPEKKPVYGVMARWDYGGWLETVGQRPSIATNYGTETYGMTEAARLFLSKTDKELADVVERNAIRYLLLDNVLTDLPVYAALVGGQSDVLVLHRDPVSGKEAYQPTQELYRLNIARLFYADGAGATIGDFQFAPVEGVRMVYESAAPALVNGLPWKVAKFKLFEFLPGVRVRVKAVPGTVVQLRQDVVTNRGRQFVYRISKAADADGWTEFQVVYPPRSGQETGAVGPVHVAGTGHRRAINVNAADITEGRVIELKE